MIPIRFIVIYDFNLQLLNKTSFFLILNKSSSYCHSNISIEGIDFI